MPFDFDAEYDSPEDRQESQPEQFADVADRAMAEALGTGEATEDEDDTSYMQEVDKRLEVTTYYRELLREPLFGEKTEAGNIVEREVRLFVRQRIEILLGIKKEGHKAAAPQAPALFSDEQTLALRMFADRLLSSPTIAKADAKPSLRKSAAPATNPGPTLTKRDVKPASVQAPAPAAKAAPKPKKSGPAPLVIEKQVVNPVTGDTVTITSQRVQRPAGALPFPTTSFEMDSLTNSVAAQGVQATAAAFERMGITKK